MFLSNITPFLILAAGACNCIASPVNAHSLIVFNPPITYPKEGTTWVPGSAHNVTWETKNIPHERRGSTGLILLGYDGSESEHLDIGKLWNCTGGDNVQCRDPSAHPLASSFPIDRGYVVVTLPKDIKYRDDYFIVLFGDSGNKSQKFKIRKH